MLFCFFQCLQSDLKLEIHGDTSSGVFLTVILCHFQQVLFLAQGQSVPESGHSML